MKTSCGASLPDRAINAVLSRVRNLIARQTAQPAQQVAVTTPDPTAAYAPALITSPSPPLKKWLNEVHCTDCITLMDAMPAASVGLIVTSPPYNLRRSTGNGLKNGNGGKWAKAQLLKGYDTHDDNMVHADYVNWQRASLTAMMRVLRSDGAIFYVHKTRVQAGLLQDRSDILSGFPVRQQIIWRRKGGLNFNPGYFLPTYEIVYLICKPDFRLIQDCIRYGDVWDIPQARNIPHPTPFPVALAQRCIESTTAQVVFDPFLGSGTTAIAAAMCGRAWIGCDISQKYCEMARERINEHRRVLADHK